MTRRIMLALALIGAVLVLSPSTRSANAWTWPSFGAPTIDACGTGGSVTGYNSSHFTVAAGTNVTSCAIDLGTSDLGTRPAPVCVLSRGSAETPDDLYITATSNSSGANSVVTIARTGATLWNTNGGAVIHVHCLGRNES